MILAGLPEDQQLILVEKDVNGSVSTRDVFTVRFSLLETPSPTEPREADTDGARNVSGRRIRLKRAHSRRRCRHDPTCIGRFVGDVAT